MPIIDLGVDVTAPPTDLKREQYITPGALDVEHGSDAPEYPGIGKVVSSAFRQDNLITNYFSSETRNSSKVEDPTFDKWGAIKGTKYEPHWKSFANAPGNQSAYDDVKRQLDNEAEDDKVLEAAPWYQTVPAQMVAGTLDLPSLIPGGVFVRGAKGGFSIAKSAAAVGGAASASTALQEAGLHSLQETRSGSESAVNIGASVLLGGLLGAGGSKLLNNVEWNKAVATLEADLAKGGDAVPLPDGVAGSPSLTSAGAAAAEPGDLAGNSVAGKAAGAIAAATSRLNPMLRILQSPSAAAREIGTKLFENSVYLKKNFDGVASEPAVETLMKEWNGGLATAVRATDDAFPEYRKAGGQLTRNEFREAVGRAMRRSDEDANPFVSKVAKEWRANVFDPLKEAAITAKLLPEDVSVETAASYFSRMWNRNKLIAKEGDFKGRVVDYYGKRLEKEFAESSESHAARLARIDQEIADLNIPADQRLGTLNTLERQIADHEAQWPSLAEAADDLSDIRGQTIIARKAGDKAEVVRLKEEEKAVRGRFQGDALTAFVKTRAELRGRRRNVDLSAAGLQERSARIANAMEDAEEANFRSMERLIKRGQKLERDLDRLDADALDERVNQMADGYGAIARKAEASAARAEQTIENIKKQADAATTRDATLAAMATTEAKVGPADEAAGKLAAAKDAADRNAAKRTAADEAIAKRLDVEAQRQRALAEQMDGIAERLRVAREFDHDGLMAELRAGMDRAARITSSSSMERGARVARLGERMAEVDPARVTARVKMLDGMKRELDGKFVERWETGRGAFDVDPAAKKASFSEAAKQIADEVFATLTGKVGDGLRPEFITIKSRGPMKERTFHIPDELVEDFLENDVDVVGRRYARVMGADVELAGKFGSVDMKDQIAKIRENYAELRHGLTDEKALQKLSKQEEADVRDISAVRDLLRGQSLYSHPVEQNFGAITRMFNHFNYLRSMGEVALASLAETVRPAMVHGLTPYMKTIGQLGTNLKGIKLAVKEGQLAGNISERVLGHRLATLSDIADPYASRGPMEAFLENLTNIGSRWNGIRLLTDMQKSIASVMTQNRIIDSAASFGSVKPKEKAYLAYLGIDESMAERISKQFGAHGETVDGVKVANTEEWTDPVARRTYRAAINKDVDSIITTRSVADVPLFANTPTGRAFLQFKSFALASHQRVLLRGLQEDQSRFVSGLIAMSTIGMMTTWLKAQSGNRDEKLADFSSNPGWWISEGLDKAGIFAVPMELANTFEKASGGFNPIKTPMKAFDDTSRLSQKGQNRNEIGSLLGPTVGMLQDVMTVGGVPAKMLKGEDVTIGQKNAGERLLPFNSYLGVRQMMRYLVNPPN